MASSESNTRTGEKRKRGDGDGQSLVGEGHATATTTTSTGEGRAMPPAAVPRSEAPRMKSFEVPAKVLTALRKLMRHEYAELFCRPVNPEADMCPDYPEKIKTPMDLGTIMERLKELTHDKTEQGEDGDYGDSSDGDSADDDAHGDVGASSSPSVSVAKTPSEYNKERRAAREKQHYVMAAHNIPTGFKGTRLSKRTQLVACPALYNDLELVWSNCIAYNGPDFWLSQNATELRKMCETTIYPFIGMEKMEVQPHATEKAATTIRSKKKKTEADGNIPATINKTNIKVIRHELEQECKHLVETIVAAQSAERLSRILKVIATTRTQHGVDRSSDSMSELLKQHGLEEFVSSPSCGSYMLCIGKLPTEKLLQVREAVRQEL